eukprot:s34_g7.t1
MDRSSGMLAPLGKPTTYGPRASSENQRGTRAIEVSPFWSDSVQQDVVLRAMRPQGLPPEDVAMPGSAGQRASGTTEVPQQPDLRELLTMVFQQNTQLKKELDELRGRLQGQEDLQAANAAVLAGVEFSKEKEKKPLPIEDRKTESDGKELEWKTPPESQAQGSRAPSGTTHVQEPQLAVEPQRVESGKDEIRNGPQDQPVGNPNQAVVDALTTLVTQLAAGGVSVPGFTGTTVGGQVQPSGGQPGLGSVQGGIPGQSVDQALRLGVDLQGLQGRIGPSGGIGHGVPGVHQVGVPEMNWFPGLGESIRTVELPPLPGIKEGELGGTVIGDWIALITPIMRDLSASSSQWWEAVVKNASEAYQQWLHTDPLNRLYIQPQVPMECTTGWLRIEQRGQSMLLCALPEGLKSEVLASRSTQTVQILYRTYTRYQPGGLGERALLLRQLVEGTGKPPTTVVELLDQLRGWKRSLKRAEELKVATPDPTLLIGALDRMSGMVTKTSPQAAFRLNTTRAALMVDISPTLTGVVNYADSVLAEAEGMYHGGMQLNTAVKVKAIDGPQPEPQQPSKGTGKGKSEEKGSEGGKGSKPLCKFFGTPDGCKKGAECTYVHNWDGIDRRGRCWNCSSTKHSRKDCTVKAVGGVAAEGGKGKKGGEAQAAPSLKKSEQKEKPAAEQEKGPGVTGGSTGTSGGEGDPGLMPASGAPAMELIKEATSLLKSLKIPALKAVRISSLEVKGGGRALLDGGATHALRTAADLHEWESGIEVKVELAQGHTTLRQLPWTGTLLSSSPVQCIVRLGVLAEIGYAIRWEGTVFELLDPAGCVVDSKLEGSCPTVSEELGLELIKEVEKYHLERRARLAVLRGEGNVGELPMEEVKHLEELRKMFPEVPEHLLVRVLPGQKAAGKHREGDLPWNRRQRKRLRRAQQVVVHLFSGKDEKFWKRELETQNRAVLCIDTELDSRHNLLRDDVMEFLLELADRGNTSAWLGGPPCRTMSRLRYRQPGPPPLRAREGPERFGLKDLEEFLRRRVEDDTVLWLRQYYLYHRAKRASTQKVLYLSEQPEDPERYLDPVTIAKQRYPSYWAFPEWDWMKHENDFIEVHFDQGPTGHETRKPTTLGTNIYELQSLNGLRGPGTSSTTTVSHYELPLEERITKSKGWAAWSSGLKAAIATAIQRELNPWLRKMTLDQWKQHLKNDHQPYYRGCRTCLEACGQSRPHRKIVTPESYTLGIDLAGPFKKGVDQLGEGRYMLVGTYTLPTSLEGKPLHLREDGEEATADRCRNPGGEGDGTAPAEVPRRDDQPVEGGIFDDGEDAPISQEGGEIQGEEEEDPLQLQEDEWPESPKDEKDDDRQGGSNHLHGGLA